MTAPYAAGGRREFKERTLSWKKKTLFGKEDEIFNFLSLEDTEITEEISRLQEQIGKKNDKINILGQKQVKVRSLMQQFKKPAVGKTKKK